MMPVQDGLDNDSAEDHPVVRRSKNRDSEGALSAIAGSFGAAGARVSTPLSLNDLFTGGELVQYILQSNTFFHGKIGFYKRILAKIYQTSGVNAQEVERISREEDLASNENGDRERVSLLPIAESEEVLNRLVALALRNFKYVWLVAPLFSVQKHLLITFNNFFVTGTLEELSTLRDIFQLESGALEGVISPRRSHGLFITDYVGLAKPNGSSTVTVVPLDYPELPIVRRVPKSNMRA